jgi:hypothetical protein
MWRLVPREYRFVTMDIFTRWESRWKCLLWWNPGLLLASFETVRVRPNLVSDFTLLFPVWTIEHNCYAWSATSWYPILTGWILTPEIDHEYGNFPPRNPGSFGIEQFLTVNTALWRAWLRPWTQPVPAGWCTAPRSLHHATCTVNSPAYVFSNKPVLSQLLSLVPDHSGDLEFVEVVSFLLHTHTLSTSPCGYRLFLPLFWACWTKPVPAGWCTAPRTVHSATCTANSPACILYIALSIQ